MSRFGASLTPFDVEPATRVLEDLRHGFMQDDRRKQEDLKKLDQFVKEMRDGCNGEEELSREREAELTAIIAEIFENSRRYKLLGKELQQTRELLGSRVEATPHASSPDPRPQRTTSVNQSENTTVMVAAANPKIHCTRARQNQRQGQAAATNSPLTRDDEQGKLYKDLMPRNGPLSLPSADRARLGDSLHQQLEAINRKRKREVSARDYHAVFGDRAIFFYYGVYYVARCPIHPGLHLDFEGAKKHYRSKHLVADKRKVHLETMRYFGTRIMGTKDEIDMYFEATPIIEEDFQAMPVVAQDGKPSLIVTLRTSKKQAARDTAQPETQSTNGMTGIDALAVAAPENEVSDSDAASSTDMLEAADMSLPTETQLEIVCGGLLHPERSQMLESSESRSELAAGPDSWTWTTPAPTWLSASQEATLENNDLGSSNNPIVVLDIEEGGASNDAAVAVAVARDPQTPSHAEVKMQYSPSDRQAEPETWGWNLF